VTELTKTRLRRVAKIMVEHEVFPDEETAFRRLHRDYPRGYPNDQWIDGLLNAADSGRLVEVTMMKGGYYNYFAESSIGGSR
jgi:hypothetical protein